MLTHKDILKDLHLTTQISIRMKIGNYNNGFTEDLYRDGRWLLHIHVRLVIVYSHGQGVYESLGPIIIKNPQR